MTTVRTAVADGLMALTLDGPGVNSIDEEALTGLARALDHVEQDEDVRVLTLRGSGGTFCVGLDLAVLERAFADHAYFRDVLGRFHGLLLRLETCPVPVVAAVNGTTRAGGLELLLACDLAVIAREARVADHHLASGVMPGGGATARLPRRVSPMRARELLYTARWLDGQQAVHYGLGVRCVAGADLERALEDLVAPMRRMSRTALAATKAAVAASEGLPMAAAVEVELDHFARFLETDGSDEGYRAFIEGREPSWRR